MKIKKRSPVELPVVYIDYQELFKDATHHAHQGSVLRWFLGGLVAGAIFFVFLKLMQAAYSLPLEKLAS